MFDDPKKELERLQNELLADRKDQEAEEYGGDDMDTDQALEDIRRMLARDDWEEEEREPLYRSYTDWEEEAPPAGSYIPDEPRRKRERNAPEPPRQRPRYGCLLTVLLLETIGLAVMALGWYLWLK